MLHKPNEVLRKSLHIAFGLCAFTLKWLPWWAAAIVAACAVAGNFIVLHRIVGTRVARHERGWDVGIVLYPLSVLALILVFRNHLQIAAAAWAILAFGDGFATMIGRRIRIGPLPWNGDKSWGGFIAFFIAGSAGGIAIAMWMGGLAVTDVIITVLVCAIVESAPLGVDDNVTVPFAAAVTFAVLSIAPPGQWYVLPPRAHVWLAIHTALALGGWLLRTVDVSGLFGGWLVGAVILLGAGWPLYVTLLTFFFIGSIATRVGYARKRRM